MPPLYHVRSGRQRVESTIRNHTHVGLRLPQSEEHLWGGHPSLGPVLNQVHLRLGVLFPETALRHVPDPQRRAAIFVSMLTTSTKILGSGVTNSCPVVNRPKLG